MGLAAALNGCGGSNHSPPATTKPPAVDSLEVLGLFEDTVLQTPSKGVVPYDVIAALYADEAQKLRFLVLPKGKKAAYDPTVMWEYPDGTRFVKTFFYYADARDPSLGRRLLETRIIENTRRDVWTGRNVWDDAQTEAVRRGGRTVRSELRRRERRDRSLDYQVPNDNECKMPLERSRLARSAPAPRGLDHVMGGARTVAPRHSLKSSRSGS
jgi:hypothetical protein